MLAGKPRGAYGNVSCIPDTVSLLQSPEAGERLKAQRVLILQCEHALSHMTQASLACTKVMHPRGLRALPNAAQGLMTSGFRGSQGHGVVDETGALADHHPPPHLLVTRPMPGTWSASSRSKKRILALQRDK